MLRLATNSLEGVVVAATATLEQQLSVLDAAQMQPFGEHHSWPLLSTAQYPGCRHAQFSLNFLLSGFLIFNSISVSTLFVCFDQLFCRSL